MAERREVWVSAPQTSVDVKPSSWHCSVPMAVTRLSQLESFVTACLLGVPLGCSSHTPTIDESGLTRCASDAGDAFIETELVVESARHTEAEIDYGREPPAGGDHSACWGRWGVHDSPLPPARFVHNMEHGGVVLMYNCDEDCPQERAWLTQFAQRNVLTIVTEYPHMASRFAVSAWGARATSSCLDPDFVQDFYSRRVNRAPERFALPPPEPPVNCR